MKAVRDAALVEGGGRGRLEALRARLEGAAGRTADSVAERDDRPRDGPLVQRVGAGRQGSVGRPALSRPRGGREGRDRGRGGPLSRGGLRPGARQTHFRSRGSARCAPPLGVRQLFSHTVHSFVSAPVVILESLPRGGVFVNISAGYYAACAARSLGARRL
ncbi:unnamed protein product [Prorocentrum cordatum]|uniref:Uncharacterized protein n=1 Tax=Prorocentrum cordatum TaxID=2364126 RepID=A0ABN9UFQ2_9DINO|nr:unnamed protein product [Polarella glacialis]